MTIHKVTQVPVIPGWATSRPPVVGGLRAERMEPLSDYQILYGCKDLIVTETPKELEWLCLAETVKAEMVARAEQAIRENV